MHQITLASALVLVIAPASAQDHTGAHATAAAQVIWGPAPPVLPKGAQFAVLAGDPSKAGPFTIRLKMPAGYKVPAHSHPTAEEVTVISGECGFGMGDKLYETKAQRLAAGGFVDLPPNMNHFAFAGTDAIVQINSEGPFAIKYADPAEDPSRSQ